MPPTTCPSGQGDTVMSTQLCPQTHGTIAVRLRTHPTAESSFGWVPRCEHAETRGCFVSRRLSFYAGGVVLGPPAAWESSWKCRFVTDISKSGGGRVRHVLRILRISRKYPVTPRPQCLTSAAHRNQVSSNRAGRGIGLECLRVTVSLRGIATGHASREVSVTAMIVKSIYRFATELGVAWHKNQSGAGRSRRRKMHVAAT